MTFKQLAHNHLTSEKIGFTQGATKTTVDTYKKGKTEIIIFDSSVVLRKVAKDNSYTSTIFKHTDMEMLRIILSPRANSVFFCKTQITQL